MSHAQFSFHVSLLSDHGTLTVGLYQQKHMDICPNVFCHHHDGKKLRRDYLNQRMGINLSCTPNDHIDLRGKANQNREYDLACRGEISI